MNTIIGFACAVGFDMGFNSIHYEEETDTAIHVHADGKQHQHSNEDKSHHEEEVTDIAIHVHTDGKQHQHHNEVKSHHNKANNQDQKLPNDENNCCHNEVAQISQQDKIIMPSKIILSPVFFTTFITSFYDINFLSIIRDSHIRYYIRNHHPPIPDIRIAIQSFQI